MLNSLTQHRMAVTRRDRLITRAPSGGTPEGVTPITAGGADQYQARGKVMDDDTGLGDLGQLDDFQVIAERVRVMDALAALTDRYRRLNQEMRKRVTLAWMAR